MTATDRYSIVRSNQQIGNTSMSMFAQPAAPTSGDRLDLKASLGALLLIEPSAFEAGFTTEHGPADVVRAAVAVIDGPGAGDTYEDNLFFGKVIVGQLRTQVGEKVLGRVSQGEKKPGKNPAWILTPATAADQAKAEAYVRAQAAPTFATPAATGPVAPF